MEGLHCFYQHNHETTEDKHTCAVGMHINTYVAHNHGFIHSWTHINQCFQIEIHIRHTSIYIDHTVCLLDDKEVARGHVHIHVNILLRENMYLHLAFMEN